MLKIAVLAPIPSASVRTTTAAKLRARPRFRKEYFTSCRMVPMAEDCHNGTLLWSSSGFCPNPRHDVVRRARYLRSCEQLMCLGDQFSHHRLVRRPMQHETEAGHIRRI